MSTISHMGKALYESSSVHADRKLDVPIWTFLKFHWLKGIYLLDLGMWSAFGNRLSESFHVQSRKKWRVAIRIERYEKVVVMIGNDQLWSHHFG